MNKKLSIIINLLLFIFLLPIVNAETLFSHEGDSILYDNKVNKYTILYIGDDGQKKKVDWFPSSDVSAIVNSNFYLDDYGTITYEYEIIAHKDSKLPINSFHFYGLSNYKSDISSPADWDYHFRKSYEENSNEKRISWYTTSAKISAGMKVKGFKVISSALPVYNVAYVAGDTDTLGFTDHGPNQYTHMYFIEEIVVKQRDREINTSIPLIPVDVPFNPAKTYKFFDTFLQKYIEDGYIDISIATDIKQASKDVLLAINKSNNDTILKLKNLIELIKNINNATPKTKPLIHKEVRTILNFNINYIINRLSDS